MRRTFAPILAAALLLSVLGLSAPRPATAAVPALRVGCVYSKLTIDWMNRHSRLNGGLGYQSISVSSRQQFIIDYLKAQGYQVTVMSDADMGNPAKLANIDVLVLTSQFAMNGGPADTLKKWIAGGGGLVSMIASPRVAPELDVSASTESPEKWVRLLGTEAYEWGPLSEAYQLDFVDDPGGPHFRVDPWPNYTHPIVAAARALLNRRGHSNIPLTLDRQFSGSTGAGLELTKMIANDSNIKPVLTVTSNDPHILKPYSTWASRGYPGLATRGRYPAAVTTEYGNGRAAYFTFCPVDFLAGYNDVLARHGSQTYAAGALIESAIAWAAADDGRSGQIVRGGRTWATMNVYQDGIYFSQYAGNVGNVSTTGILRFRVYEPSGRLVKSWRHSGYLGGAPGAVYRYSNKYTTSKLKDGYYRVEFEYSTNYPSLTTMWREVAWVRRGQGLGIRTNVWGASRPIVSSAVSAPAAFSPDGDGRNDTMWLNFRVDKPTFVTVKVYTSSWKLVAQPLTNVPRAASLQAGRWNGKRANGTWLPPGKYYVTAYASNTAGTRSMTAPVTIKY